jgi:26S proteasome regulatory subunit T2
MGKQGGLPGDRKPGDGGAGDKKDRKFEPPAAPSRVGRKQRKQKGPEAAARLPAVAPLSKCRLRLLKLERVKDYLLMEEEFVVSQERLRPSEDKTEEDRSKVDDLRGTPMSVGSLEEIIDESHAIVSSSVGPEYYVGILSFVDKDQLEPGCAILMHNKVLMCIISPFPDGLVQWDWKHHTNTSVVHGLVIGSKRLVRTRLMEQTKNIQVMAG